MDKATMAMRPLEHYNFQQLVVYVGNAGGLLSGASRPSRFGDPGRVDHPIYPRQFHNSTTPIY
eukprot:scaffold5588_cov180-Amphora_coffeaeformis.AAC.1